MKKRVMRYFSVSEMVLWSASVLLIVLSFCIYDRANYLTLCASLIGVTSLIFNAKGNPIGQFLMAVFALISWMRNPYNGNRAEVKINTISRKEVWYMWVGTGLVTILFYFILEYFHTSYILPSTLSVTTSFLAFLVNDLYGFLCWQRRKRKQEKTS